MRARVRSGMLFVTCCGCCSCVLTGDQEDQGHTIASLTNEATSLMTTLSHHPFSPPATPRAD